MSSTIRHRVQPQPLKQRQSNSNSAKFDNGNKNSSNSNSSKKSTNNTKNKGKTNNSNSGSKDIRQYFSASSYPGDKRKVAAAAAVKNGRYLPHKRLDEDWTEEEKPEAEEEEEEEEEEKTDYLHTPRSTRSRGSPSTPSSLTVSPGSSSSTTRKSISPHPKSNKKRKLRLSVSASPCSSVSDEASVVLSALSPGDEDADVSAQTEAMKKLARLQQLLNTDLTAQQLQVGMDRRRQRERKHTQTPTVEEKQTQGTHPSSSEHHPIIVTPAFHRVPPQRNQSSHKTQRGKNNRVSATTSPASMSSPSPSPSPQFNEERISEEDEEEDTQTQTQRFPFPTSSTSSSSSTTSYSLFSVSSDPLPTLTFIKRHRRYEKEEREMREEQKQESLEIWVICDHCRKWRLCTQAQAHAQQLLIKSHNSKHIHYYCSGLQTPNPQQCAVVDDWIVRCVGLQTALQLAEMGLHTVDQLSRDQPAAQQQRWEAKLDKLQLCFDQDTQKISRYSEAKSRHD